MSPEVPCVLYKWQCPPVRQLAQPVLSSVELEQQGILPQLKVRAACWDHRRARLCPSQQLLQSEAQAGCEQRKWLLPRFFPWKSTAGRASPAVLSTHPPPTPLAGSTGSY